MAVKTKPERDNEPESYPGFRREVGIKGFDAHVIEQLAVQQGLKFAEIIPNIVHEWVLIKESAGELDERYGIRRSDFADRGKVTKHPSSKKD